MKNTYGQRPLLTNTNSVNHCRWRSMMLMAVRAKGVLWSTNTSLLISLAVGVVSLWPNKAKHLGISGDQSSLPKILCGVFNFLLKLCTCGMFLSWFLKIFMSNPAFVNILYLLGCHTYKLRASRDGKRFKYTTFTPHQILWVCHRNDRRENIHQKEQIEKITV